MNNSPQKPARDRGRQILITLIKFAISFAILAYLFYQAVKHDQFTQLAESPKHFGWLALAVIAGFAANIIAFFRWHMLVRALQLDFKLIDAVRLGFIGHVFNLMSFGVLGGDAIKSMFVAKQLKGKATEAVASVFADRLIGLMAMFSFAGVAFLVTDFSKLESVNPQALASVKFVCRFALFSASLGFACFFALYIFREWKQSWFVRKMISIPKIGSIIERLFEVADVYRSRVGVVASCYGMSLGCVILFAFSIYSVARGISESFPSFASHLMIAPIAMVANAVPLPGGLGGMEFALDFLYRGFSQASIPSEHGFVVALGFRVILLLVAAVGVIFYMAKKREINKLG